MYSISMRILSVIIPTNNRPNYLHKCLKSILRQTTLPMEVIVIDTSSGIESKEIFEKLFKNRRSVKAYYIKKSDVGSSTARNEGIHFAHSKYLVFLDDDCIPNKHWISEIYKAIRKYRNQVLFGGNKIFKSQNIYSIVADIRNQSGLYAHYDLDTKNFLIPKKIITKHRLYFDTRFDAFSACEDTDLGYRLKMLGYTIRYYPKIAVRHDVIMTLSSLIKRDFQKGRARLYLNRKYPQKNDLRLLKFSSLNFFIFHWNKNNLSYEKKVEIILLLCISSIIYRFGVMYEQSQFITLLSRTFADKILAKKSAPFSFGWKSFLK